MPLDVTENLCSIYAISVEWKTYYVFVVHAERRTTRMQTTINSISYYLAHFELPVQPPDSSPPHRQRIRTSIYLVLY